MVCRYSLFLKSVVPLQAYLAPCAQVLHAPKAFTMEHAAFGDEAIHLCSVSAADGTYDGIEGKEGLTSKAADAVRAVLKAFQVQFGEEIKQAGEAKKRAIYAVDVQFDETKERAHVLGLSFAPADNLDYNKAFKALFLDEVGDLVTI